MGVHPSTSVLVVLFLVGICSFTLFAMRDPVTAFYFGYYILDGEQAQFFDVVGTLALIAAIPLAKPLAHRFGNRNVFLVCSLLTGLWYILLFIPGPGDIVWVYWLNLLGKVSYAPTVPLLWRMIAHTADDSEWKNGRRVTGLFFSAATLSMKLGWGDRRRARRLPARRPWLCAKTAPVRECHHRHQASPASTW